MKNFSICLSLLISFLKVRTEDIECWSAPEYPCCPNEKVVVTDSQGTWGVVNGEWCGISPQKKCFAEFLGYKCCENDYGTVSAIDEDGSWYYDDKKKEWCGYRNSTSRWNNRESNKDTLEEYNDFKIKWNEKERDNFERLSVVVGEDESMINFGWYSTTNSSSSIFFGTKKDMSDAKTYNGTSVFYKEINGNPYYSNKVTVTGLERNSIYYYQRKLNGIYEETIKMNTYNPYNFSAIFVGDPQIGASNGRVNVEKQYKLTVENGTLNDAFNWNDTVYRAFNFVKQPSLFITTGDHVETDLRKLNNKFDPYNDPQEILYDDYIQETQYSAYFLPEILKTIPSVPTLGNHDSHTSNYMYHFNTPNSSIPKEKNPNIVNVPGYSYFYKYNNVLFVVYESNYETCDDFKIVTEKAFKKYPNMDWNIALFHHDIYGMGEAHSQEDHVINELRPCLTPLLDQYKFDLAINGHDHIYSSSHFILYNQNYDSSTSTPLYSLNKIEKNKIYTNPSGILYITANSATGSKYNQVITDSKKYGIDYIYQAKQDYTTSFGVLEFEKLYGKIRLNITSYDANNYSKVDGPFIIEKIIDDNEKCWSEKLGYACCTETTYIEYTDKSGKWGVENDKWCGIIDSPTPTPTPTPTPNPVVDEPINCWSKKLGYPCCSQTTIIELTDKDGNWGVENDGWCGIIDNSIPTPTPTPITEPEPENCWAIKLGYKCCSQTNKIKYTDKSGKWGVENNEWCGLL